MIPFTRTIGYRLWLACIAAVTIPLGINIILLNIKQYRSTLESTYAALEENALVKVDTLSQVVPLNVDILKLFTEVLDLDIEMPQAPDINLSNKIKDMFGSTYEEISLTTLSPEGKYTVIASNRLEAIGQDYTSKITLAPLSAFYATLKQSASTLDVFTVIQINIFDVRSHKPIGALYTTFNAEQVLDNLFEPSQNYLKTKTALIAKNGLILKASDPNIQMSSIFNAPFTSFCNTFLDDTPCPEELLQQPTILHATPKGGHSYTFKIHDKEMWGYLREVPNMDFYILAYIAFDDVFRSLFQRIVLYLAYFACILCGSIAVYIIAKRLTKPIRQLATVMIATRKDIHHPYQKDPLGFEVNRLGEIFNSMVNNLMEQQALAEKHHSIKENAQKTLQLGEQAQQSLLPHTLPYYPGTEIAKAYIPAITVGGDFFDVFVLGEGEQAKLYLIVADASGKGVNACGYSLFLKNMLRTLLAEIPSLKEAIDRTATLFYHATQSSGMFVTLCVYRYSYATNTMEYYSCGHNPVCYVTPDNQVSLLRHPGMALGFLPTLPDVETTTFQPTPDSLFVLYSDGVTEAHNAFSEMFGEERLIQVLATLPNNDAESVKHTLMLALKSFVGGHEQYDDITLLILRLTPPPITTQTV